MLSSNHHLFHYTINPFFFPPTIHISIRQCIHPSANTSDLPSIVHPLVHPRINYSVYHYPTTSIITHAFTSLFQQLRLRCNARQFETLVSLLNLKFLLSIPITASSMYFPPSIHFAILHLLYKSQPFSILSQ